MGVEIDSVIEEGHGNDPGFVRCDQACLSLFQEISKRVQDPLRSGKFGMAADDNFRIDRVQKLGRTGRGLDMLSANPDVG